MRASDDFAPRRCILLGLLAGGACLTKYQVSFILAPMGTLLVVRWLWLAASGRSHRHARGLMLAALVTVAVVSPHVLRNWIFYRNPVYPPHKLPLATG